MSPDVDDERYNLTTMVSENKDRAYEDKLLGKISEELWERKSKNWEDEILYLQLKLKSHIDADVNYYETGIAIIELANQACDMYLHNTRQEQRELLDTSLSNCTFYRGTLCPTYRKPFDILAKGTEFQSMRPQYHSPQTLVVFRFSIRLHYATTGGSRWKAIKYDQ